MKDWRNCVVGTSLFLLRNWNCVAGTTLLELRNWNCVVGTTLFELRCWKSFKLIISDDSELLQQNHPYEKMQTIFSPDPLVMHQGGTFPFYLKLEICHEHFSKFEFQ